MTSLFALIYDVHNVDCGLFRQSSSQRLIFVLYPSRLRQIKCNPVWGRKKKSLPGILYSDLSDHFPGLVPVN